MHVNENCWRSREHLDNALQRVLANGSGNTPGPDGETLRQMAPRRNQWLAQLAQQLARGSFQPSPPRLVAIPKKSDPAHPRVIGVLNLRDRVVHMAVKLAAQLTQSPNRDRIANASRLVPSRYSTPGASR